MKVFSYFIFFLFVNTSIAQMTETQIKLTTIEKKAVEEICTYFSNRINETGDLGTVYDELFDADFIVRFIKEEKSDIARKTKKYRPEFFSPNRVSFRLYIFFNAELLDKASLEDWKRFFIATYNLQHFETVSSMNELAADVIHNKKPNIEKFLLDIPNGFERWYPPKVIQLLDQNPKLSGFLRKNFNGEPIKTIEELRNVNETLESGLNLIKESKNGKTPIAYSEDYKKMKAKIKPTPLFAAKIVMNKDEFFGFPKGTKFIRVWVLHGQQLFIVKLNGNYKILLRTI